MVSDKKLSNKHFIKMASLLHILIACWCLTTLGSAMPTAAIRHSLASSQPLRAATADKRAEFLADFTRLAASIRGDGVRSVPLPVAAEQQQFFVPQQQASEIPASRNFRSADSAPSSSSGRQQRTTSDILRNPFTLFVPVFMAEIPSDPVTRHPDIIMVRGCPSGYVANPNGECRQTFQYTVNLGRSTSSNSNRRTGFGRLPFPGSTPTIFNPRRIPAGVNTRPQNLSRSFFTPRRPPAPFREIPISADLRQQTIFLPQPQNLLPASQSQPLPTTRSPSTVSTTESSSDDDD